MAIRGEIHVNQTERLKRYLESLGWTLEEPKGEYERIRARSGRQIFIGYKRDRSNHPSFREESWRIVGGFKKWKRVEALGLTTEDE